LLPTLRYAHAQSYLRSLFNDAGLTAAQIAAAAVRNEKGMPVDSLVVVAQPNPAHSRGSGNPVPMQR
jgi:predicted TPR repeat methyltransferase